MCVSVHGWMGGRNRLVKGQQVPGNRPTTRSRLDSFAGLSYSPDRRTRCLMISDGRRPPIACAGADLAA